MRTYFRQYLRNRPLFLSLLRAREATLYKQCMPLSGPVLDVGCGDGFFARTVFGKSAVDVGVDVPDSRIAQAQKSGAYKRVLEYNGTRLPFADNTFETVISNCVLEHVGNIDQLLSELARVVTPTGTVLITVMAYPWETYLAMSMFWKGYAGFMRKAQKHVNLFTAREWDTCLGKHFSIKKRVGYLSPGACRLLDILHWASVPSLASYIVFRRWALWPSIIGALFEKPFLQIMRQNTPYKHAGAIFFALGTRTATI